MSRSFHLIGRLVSAALITVPALAGEYLVLGNGFRIHAERHETDGDVVRVYDRGGISELPAASVASFEQEEAPLVGMPGRASSQAVAVKPSEAAFVPSTSTPPDLAASAARKYALPESFVQSVMRAESGFNPSAVSPRGATGLMQLMPETARHLGVDARDPKQNAEGGAQYLRDLLALYEDRPDQVVLALAAYNAGPAAVERYHGVPPFEETRQYILRVLKHWDGMAATGNK
jgi:soluble lytic murein transglycosylase-like protein